MSELSVIDHHLDTTIDCYRVTVGYVDEVDVPVLDAHGMPVYEPGEPVRAPRIKPVLDDQGEPVVDDQGKPTGELFEDDGDAIESWTQGKQITEKQLVTTPVEDFVFSRYDERWEGLDDTAIAKEQRRLVRASLRKRERAAADAASAANLVSMPGIGQRL